MVAVAAVPVVAATPGQFRVEAMAAVVAAPAQSQSGVQVILVAAGVPAPAEAESHELSRRRRSRLSLCRAAAPTQQWPIAGFLRQSPKDSPCSLYVLRSAFT